MTVFTGYILRRSALVVTAVLALTPAVAVAEEEGEREGGFLSGVLGQEERGFQREESGEEEEHTERSGLFSSGEGRGEGEAHREGSGLFSRGEGGEEHGEEKSRHGGFLGGEREGGDREMEEE